MLPTPPQMGTPAQIHGAHAIAYQVALPPSDIPVSPIRLESTPGVAAKSRAPLRVSSTNTPICVRPYGASSLFSVAHSSRLLRRTSHPLGEMASVAKPRRANSRAQPISLCSR